MKPRGFGFFLLQVESKKLYKKFMKITKGIENEAQRRDLRSWIRDDFRMNKKLSNEIDIKSQHIRARMALDELETSIDLSRAKSGNKKS